MEYRLGEFCIYDEREKVVIESVTALLEQSYWANQRSLDVIKTSIENSVCFSLFKGEKQIGFARVVTDFASVAYLADVIIDEQFRGQGLGKWLTETMVNDPRWKDKFKFLVTDDAHSLYSRLGFSSSGKLMSTKV
ncbi:GNAT family N-acetyltransferase [Neptuniibacter sp. PT8_73]|uniref:GNAT family N-acetyltransferase n=1 Tax=Neptuniibacter sp. PT8_73 TaxID=3398206 RepID=UPI0039F63A2F